MPLVPKLSFANTYVCRTKQTQNLPVAQWIERKPAKFEVAGSSPVEEAKFPKIPSYPKQENTQKQETIYGQVTK